MPPEHYCPKCLQVLPLDKQKRFWMGDVLIMRTCPECKVELKENDFRNDPLIDKALKMFEGTFISTHTHRDGTTTEIEAAAAVQGSVEGQKKQILAIVSKAGEDGIIAEHIAEKMGLRAQSMDRRRLYDLRLEGKVRHHPENRQMKNARGRNCICWVLGDDPKKGTRAKKR